VTDGIRYEVRVSNDLSTFRLAGSSNSNSRVSTNNDNRLTTRFLSPRNGFGQLAVSFPTSARQKTLLTPALAARLEQEDLPEELTEEPKRLCACGQEH